MTTRAWGGVEYGIVGDEALESRLLSAATEFPEIVARALVAEGELEVSDIAAHTPIGGGADDHDPHVGKLRGSERAIPLVEQGELKVIIAAGGRDADVEYAIKQHQKLSYKHPHGGEADYMIATLERAAKGGSMLTNIAARVENDLRELVGA